MRTIRGNKIIIALSSFTKLSESSGKNFGYYQLTLLPLKWIQRVFLINYSSQLKSLKDLPMRIRDRAPQQTNEIIEERSKIEQVYIDPL